MSLNRSGIWPGLSECIANRIESHAVPAQDFGRTAFFFSKNTQQQVLCPHMSGLESSRFLVRISEDPLVCFRQG